MALHDREQRDSLYSRFVEEYERLIYPSDRQTPEAITKQKATRSAAEDLAELYQGRLNQRAWGMHWFEELGEPPTPIDCWLFSHAVLEMFAAISQTLEASGPAEKMSASFLALDLRPPVNP